MRERRTKLENWTTGQLGCRTTCIVRTIRSRRRTKCPLATHESGQRGTLWYLDGWGRHLIPRERSRMVKKAGQWMGDGMFLDISNRHDATLRNLFFADALQQRTTREPSLTFTSPDTARLPVRLLVFPLPFTLKHKYCHDCLSRYLSEGIQECLAGERREECISRKGLRDERSKEGEVAVPLWWSGASVMVGARRRRVVEGKDSRMG